MDDDDQQASNEAKPEEYANQMQFSAIQEQTYGNQDNYYNFQINDFQYYLDSFYGDESPQNQFTDVASNIMSVMASQPTHEQKLGSAIVSIFKQHPDKMGLQI